MSRNIIAVPSVLAFLLGEFDGEAVELCFDVGLDLADP